MGWTGTKILEGVYAPGHTHEFPTSSLDEPQMGAVFQCSCGTKQAVTHYFQKFHEPGWWINWRDVGYGIEEVPR